MECPACGGPVTVEVGPNRPPSATVADAVFAAEEQEKVVVSRTCWTCGWGEDRTITVTSIEPSRGDPQTVERAALREAITTEASAIDDLATLEDALAAIRRHRDRDIADTHSEDVDGGA